mmetsp:Transcript_74555/g.189167  ORF Transcript_74555/g.189167 Transcript_74555/m.189167 type:complete len:123 (+) Transcript_74555:165-533(+)
MSKVAPRSGPGPCDEERGREPGREPGLAEVKPNPVWVAPADRADVLPWWPDGPGEYEPRTRTGGSGRSGGEDAKQGVGTPKLPVRHVPLASSSTGHGPWRAGGQGRREAAPGEREGEGRPAK